MPINLVTSFNVKAWDLYAKDFLTSFDEKWDDQIQLAVYYDGGELPEDIVERLVRTTVSLKNKKRLKQNGLQRILYRMKHTTTVWMPHGSLIKYLL